MARTPRRDEPQGLDGAEDCYDENGVDRSQIRAMLELTPEQRLRRVQAFVEDIFVIWEQNGVQGPSAR